MVCKFAIDEVIGFIKRNIEKLINIFCIHNDDFCRIPIEIEDNY